MLVCKKNKEFYVKRCCSCSGYEEASAENRIDSKSDIATSIQTPVRAQCMYLFGYSWLIHSCRVYRQGAVLGNAAAEAQLANTIIQTARNHDGEMARFAV